MQGIPYASLVAYYSTEDLKNLIFATSKKTNKFQNLMKNSNTSFLIDNRENNPSDFNNAITITAFGKAEEIIENLDYFRDLLIKKYPSLRDFIYSSDCALLRINIEKYQFVSNFQNVEYIYTNGDFFKIFQEKMKND
jgi:hypothetical protein